MKTKKSYVRWTHTQEALVEDTALSMFLSGSRLPLHLLVKKAQECLPVEHRRHIAQTKNISPAMAARLEKMGLPKLGSYMLKTPKSLKVPLANKPAPIAPAPVMQLPASIDEIINERIATMLDKRLNAKLEARIATCIGTHLATFKVELADTILTELVGVQDEIKNIKHTFAAAGSPPKIEEKQTTKVVKPMRYDVVLVDWDAKRLWKDRILKLVKPSINVHFMTPSDNRLCHADWFPHSDLYVVSELFFHNHTCVNDNIRRLNLDAGRLRYFTPDNHTDEHLVELVNSVIGLPQRPRSH